MSGFRYPNITGLTEKDQLRQLKSYLYQLVEQLNNIPTQGAVTPEAQPVSSGAAAPKEGSAAADFATLKGLIIKSADIVNAYSDKIEKKLAGQYVAVSEFGSYAEQVSSQLVATADRLDQKYNSLQTLVTDLETRLLETAGYIRTGILYYAADGDPLPNGAPVYGMEVGQQTADGEFHRFSRFTSYSMTFFDANGEVFAAITEGKLTIRNAVISHSFTLGGFTDTVQPDGSLVTRWKGV